MEELLHRVALKKAELDRLRLLAPQGLGNLEYLHDLELTYTSIAIEGNTLTAAEITQVVEQGIAIGGKRLKDHLEAVDHYDAVRYVRELARRGTPVTETDVCMLHRLVVRRSDPEIAGRYADRSRFVLTEAGWHVFPSPAEVPALMDDFAAWLGAAPDAPTPAFTAHRRLLEIHPFNDGSGRTARLLMNLVLLRGGYPPVSIWPEDRPAYFLALQQAGPESLCRLLYPRLDATMGQYLNALLTALTAPAAKGEKPTPRPDDAGSPG